MERPQLNALVSRMYERCTTKVIERLQKYPEDARLSGGDSGLSGVWEEIVVQVRGGESPYFGAYEVAIGCEADVVVDELSSDERTLLWCWSDAYYSWEDDDRLPCDEELRRDVSDEIVTRVLSAADDWELSEEVERAYLYPGEDEPPTGQEEQGEV